jgi:DNA-binding MarR family transcriptional regulator
VIVMPALQHPVPRPCACTTVRRASRILARVFDATLEPTGLNVTQLAVLRAVQRHPKEPLTRVAEDLCMDRTSLYRAVRPMQRDGWLTLVTGDDARSRTARITAKGLRVLGAADLPWQTTQTEIIDRFGREKWAALVFELERLSACARTAESITTGQRDA